MKTFHKNAIAMPHELINFNEIENNVYKAVKQYFSHSSNFELKIIN
jgi:hypothetical protein